MEARQRAEGKTKPRVPRLGLIVDQMCGPRTRGGAGVTMGLHLGLTCVLIISLEPASCFFAGTKAVIPAGIAPQHVAHQNRAQTSSISMVAQAPIAWPDEVTTPLPDQPIRARILAVAPDGVASPFEDRGTAVPWFEVCGVRWYTMYHVMRDVESAIENLLRVDFWTHVLCVLLYYCCIYCCTTGASSVRPHASLKGWKLGGITPPQPPASWLLEYRMYSYASIFFTGHVYCRMHTHDDEIRVKRRNTREPACPSVCGTLLET